MLRNKFLSRVMMLNFADGDVDPSIINPPTGGGDTPPTDEPPAAEPPAAEPPASVIDPTKWLDLLPEDLKTSSELSRVKSLEDLAKNYVQSQKFISSSVRIPAEDAPPEELDKFYSRLGVPETPDKYEISVSEDFKALGMVPDDSMLEGFKSVSKKNNLTPKQAQGVVDGYYELEAEKAKVLVEQANNEFAESQQVLKKEWRGAYQDNVDLINANLTRIFPEGSLEKLKSSGLLRDANFIKSIHSLTKMLSGDTLYIEGQEIADVDNSLAGKEKELQKLLYGNYNSPASQERASKLYEEIATLKQAQRQQAMRRNAG
jgi:hypothetical protein